MAETRKPTMGKMIFSRCETCLGGFIRIKRSSRITSYNVCYTKLLRITPSHNPPDNGGIKYNPPNGGPADTDVTGWIAATANIYLRQGLQVV